MRWESVGEETQGGKETESSHCDQARQAEDAGDTQGAGTRSGKLFPPWGDWMLSTEQTGALPWGLRFQQR